MDAMIGRIEATPGNRDALAEALVLEVDSMPGCLTYLVAVKPGDLTGVWIAEAWASDEATSRVRVDDSTSSRSGSSGSSCAAAISPVASGRGACSAAA